MSIFQAIINSAKKAWRGEEKLWKVFWLWGVVFGLSVAIIPYFYRIGVIYLLSSFIGMGIISAIIRTLNKNKENKLMYVGAKIYVSFLLLCALYAIFVVVVGSIGCAAHNEQFCIPFF